MSSEDDEILQAFIEESVDHLADIETDLLAIEKRGVDFEVNLEELLRIPAAQIKERIEWVGDAEVVRLRGTLLPLIRMADVLGIERTYHDENTGGSQADRRRNIADRRSRTSPFFAESSEAATGSGGTIEQRQPTPDRRQSPTSAFNIVVVSAGALKYGLIVDRLLDSEEIVIKPLGRHL